jgi:hypothetical protein
MLAMLSIWDESALRLDYPERDACGDAKGDNGVVDSLLPLPKTLL